MDSTIQARRNASHDVLPVSVDGITPDWLSLVMSAGHQGVQVITSQTDQVMWGTATKVRVKVSYNDRGQELQLPTSLIVKGGFAEHRHLMAYLYLHEVRFFNDILPHLPGINVPRCLFAGSDAHNDQSIVVLEDLTLRNTTLCRVQTPLTFAQAAGTLDTLARVHARWWNSPELDDDGALSWIPYRDPLPDGSDGTYQRSQLLEGNWNATMELPRGVAVPKMIHDRRQMERALLKLKAFNRTGPKCLLHGDSHMGNMYYEEGGTPGILDWQTYRRGPWSHDFTYFLVSALDILDRRKWDRELLSYYLDRLAAYGVQQAPGFDDAWEAYRRQIVHGLYFWLVNPVEFQEEVNNCAVAPRFAMAAVDLDTFDLMS